MFLLAPGCALRKYKPYLIQKVKDFLMCGEYLPCCKEFQDPGKYTTLIACCPYCLHMFESQNVKTVSLWKMLLDSDFHFPDYNGERMTIHDSCHARKRNSSEMQSAVRNLCRRMNITLIEPHYTRDDTRCCGGSSKDYETRKQMALNRAMDFPERNVVVYCTGCVRSFSLTNVYPRHILDLLFEEPTEGLTVIR